MTWINIDTSLAASSDKGFTIIETLVTTIVVTLFATGFFQSYMVLESQRINTLRQAKASDIAYSNLRKYPSKPSALTCAAANATGGVTLGDSNTNSASSPSVYGFVPEASTSYLANNTRQVVKAYAPNGCTGTNFNGGMVKIVSTVTYDTNGKVEHASYVQ